jgi:hypothetical protein
MTVDRYSTILWRWEQIMACLLAEMKAGQEETKAEIRINQEEIKTNPRKDGSKERGQQKQL